MFKAGFRKQGKNKLFMVIASLIVMAGLFAGCSSGAKTGAPQEVAKQEPTVTKEATSNKEQIVNIYTARNYEVDDKVINLFSKETGIKVNVVKGAAEELIERIKREGASTQADLFITVDGGVLANAKQNDILQPATSPTINQNVPAQFRDRDNYWIGMATRARVIVYAKDRVKPDQLSTYEDLTSDHWKGKVLVRSSTNLYNQSLLASFIELNGADKAEAWAKGLVNNFARKPEGSDRDQAKAVVAGIGDVAIVNTYYIGLLGASKDPEEVKVANSVGVFFPNQQTNGTHVNISGIGLTRYSKNKANAIKLIEFMTGKQAQEIISAENFEFPVNPAAAKAELLKSWGEFKIQSINFDTLGQYNKKALEIFNITGWK